MSHRNIIQETFDSYGKQLGAHKSSGSWYLPVDEVTAVLDLQKSQYGPAYYINVGWWLRADLRGEFPKPQQCHIQTRAGSFAPPEMESRLKDLLDLESPIGEAERAEELTGFLSQYVSSKILAVTAPSDFRSELGLEVLRVSLVNAEGQRLLSLR